MGILASAIVAAVFFFITTSRAGGLSGVQWNQVGPSPLMIDANQNFQGAGPDSGKVDEIAIDPRGTSDQIIYIATDNGGIWKSTDGGTTWAPMTDSLGSLSGGVVALDKGNPSIVYYGTGNGFSAGFNNPIGLYVSPDEGKSWTLANGSSTLVGKNIIRMVSPAANVLVVATNSGLFRSTDGGNSFTNIIPPGASATSYITDLRLDTTAANTVLAAVYGLGIFISSDGGATFGANLWTSSNNSPLEPPNNPALIGFIAIGQSKAPNNHYIYATVQNTGPTIAAPSRFLGMWRSTDLGATWANIPAAGGVESTAFPTPGPGDQNGTAGSGCQCGYDQTLGVDPLDANRVYIGFQQVWLSTNAALPSPGAVTFGATAITFNQVHWDNHAMVFSPASHEVTPPTFYPIYTGQDGGIATSTNGGTTWTNINGNAVTGIGAIATNLFRGIDIGRGSPTNNKTTFGGTQDCGTIEFRPPFLAQTWHLGIDGDGLHVAVDPGNPSVAIGSDDATSIRTTNGGATWTFGIPTLPGNINAVAFDPIPADKIAYAESVTSPNTTLYQSTDEGATWTAMHLIPNDVGVTSIGGTPADGNTVWLGLNDGTLTFTNQALLGASAIWNNATVTGAPAGQPVSAVAIDPTNPAVVVVTYPGFTGINPNTNPTKHVFMTIDSGGHWTDISGTVGGGIQNLPDVPVNSVTIDPNTTPHTIIIGTDAGVFQTADDGNSWQVLGLGLPTVQVTSVQLDSSAVPELLRAGTYGRSVFELGAATTGLLQVNSNFNFGTVCGSGSVTELLQLFNVGVSDLHISSISRVAGSNDFSISGPSTPLVIKAGGEVDFTITFTPSAPNVTETATFQINSDDPFHPALQVTYTATSGTVAISVPNGLTFPPTVILNRGACHSLLGVPIANGSNSCGLKITNLGISGTNASEYSLTGEPTLPITLAPGAQLGSGDLDAVFTPNRPLARTNTAQVNVTYESDPILHTTATAAVPMCGESTQRGMRALVLLGGTPVAKVHKFTLVRVNEPSEDISPLTLIDQKFGAPLTTVTGTPPCPSFQYQYEFGTVTHPISLQPNVYVLVVTIDVGGGKFKTKTDRFALNTCDFDKDLVVSFP